MAGRGVNGFGTFINTAYFAIEFRHRQTPLCADWIPLKTNGMSENASGTRSVLDVFLVRFRISKTRLRFRNKSDRTRAYGYSFQGSDPLPPTRNTTTFAAGNTPSRVSTITFAKLTSANCFNSLYPQVELSWVEKSISVADSIHFGRWLRENQLGESVNGFPPSISSAKTIGNYYLSFIESSGELRSAAIIRFSR